MKFGIREICDVVLKAKSIMKIGNKVFYKDEPVLYFDSLKTSSMEGAATTVYAQGGRGNSRLIAWEGERTVTFTMEDALLSTESFSILSGADLLKYSASDGETIKEHVIERTNLIEFFPGYQKSTAFVNGRNYYTYNSNTHEYIPVESPSAADIENYYDTYTYSGFYYSTVRFNTRYPGSDNWDGWDSANATPDQYCSGQSYNGEFYFLDSTTGYYHIAHPQIYQRTNGKYYWREEGETGDPIDRTYFRRDYGDERNTAGSNRLCIYINQKPYDPIVKKQAMFLDNYIYISRYKNNECVTEPFLPWKTNYSEYVDVPTLIDSKIYHKYCLVLRNNNGTSAESTVRPYSVDFLQGFVKNIEEDNNKPPKYVLDDDCTVLVDYYVERPSGYKLNITPDKFGGNFYLEGSTLFRSTDGQDLPAKIIIPNCKIQSNFTFNMASSGDPSTFTFTLDAFPDYTRFDKTKKVLAAIQILESNAGGKLPIRTDTPNATDFMTIAAQATREKTWTEQEPNTD